MALNLELIFGAKVQMIIEDVEPIENVRLVMVELDPLQAGNIQEQHRLQEILQQQDVVRVIQDDL